MAGLRSESDEQPDGDPEHSVGEQRKGGGAEKGTAAFYTISQLLDMGSGDQKAIGGTN